MKKSKLKILLQLFAALVLAVVGVIALGVKVNANEGQEEVTLHELENYSVVVTDETINIVPGYDTSVGINYFLSIDINGVEAIPFTMLEDEFMSFEKRLGEFYITFKTYSEENIDGNKITKNYKDQNYIITVENTHATLRVVEIVPEVVDSNIILRKGLLRDTYVLDVNFPKRAEGVEYITLKAKLNGQNYPVQNKDGEDIKFMKGGLLEKKTYKFKDLKEGDRIELTFVNWFYDENDVLKSEEGLTYIVTAQKGSLASAKELILSYVMPTARILGTLLLVSVVFRVVGSIKGTKVKKQSSYRRSKTKKGRR